MIIEDSQKQLIAIALVSSVFCNTLLEFYFIDQGSLHCHQVQIQINKKEEHLK